jgi:hypothetical protein
MAILHAHDAETMSQNVRLNVAMTSRQEFSGDWTLSSKFPQSFVHPELINYGSFT